MLGVPRYTYRFAGAVVAVYLPVEKLRDNMWRCDFMSIMDGWWDCRCSERVVISERYLSSMDDAP